MLSIKIDTKSLELVIYQQFNNIKFSLFASHMKSSFPLCTVIIYSRVHTCKFVAFQCCDRAVGLDDCAFQETDG